MQIYIAKSGQQTGPFSEEQIQSMLSSGMIALTDSGWHEGLPAWLPLHDLLNVAPPIPQPPPIPPKAVPNPSVSQVRPWIRYWARLIDIFLFVLCAGFAIGIVAPALLPTNEYLTGVLFIFIWCFVEPMFLAGWGATPGKALLRVSVRNADGSRLDYGSALSRSFDVWFRGYGIGFPLISLFTQLAAYNTLTKNGITSWDLSRNLRVTHDAIGPVRVIVAVVLFVIFAFIMSLAKNAS